MSSSLEAPLLGIASALSWGGGDFCGGLATKRAPALGVVAVTFAAGLAIVVALALAAGEPLPSGAAIGWACAAGVSGAVGLAALYQGLAAGRMSVVAPVSAVLAAGVPAAWGAATEGLPPGPRLAGFALAIAGIWLVARPRAGGAGHAGLGLAVAAGCGFGGFLVFMHAGARGGVFWPLAAARSASLLLVLATTLASRQPWAPPRAALPLAVLSGALDAGGNAFFVLAGRAGRLDVAAVLSSMYPASTIALATVLLRERIGRAQGVGIAALLAAITLIAG